MNNAGLLLKILVKTAPDLRLFPLRSKDEQVKFQKFAEKYLAAFYASKSTTTDGLFRRSNFTLSQGRQFAIRRAVQHTLDDRVSSEEQDQICSLCTAVILHYYSFLQKQHFERLHKLKAAQQGLPIYNYRNEIVDAIAKHQVVIIAGDTGCGKSTQTPQYLLEAGYQKIACTQPRRIAAISLAKRVAYECLSRHSDLVGYQIRFEKAVSKKTKLVFLTEGLLLRQFQTDSQLSNYDLIILDEVHERHIFTDFMLGILLCLCRFRSDLKVCLMSATINVNLFSKYFDGAPVISVPGRLYPIELHYMPQDDSKRQKYAKSRRPNDEDDDYDSGGKGKSIDPRPYIRVLQIIDNKYPSSERGDVLLFVSGMSAISILSQAIQHYAEKTGKWLVLPLHSCLSADEQDRVFDLAPDGVRKCIVATNIAETSVTIDGVRFVIDSGKMKEMLYDPKYKLQRLTEFWISQASAEQRKGRAGRTGPGVCYRMYAESDFDSFSAYPLAEIQRVSLDSLVLQMIAGNLRHVKKFPFIEPPQESALDASLSYLRQVGAIETDSTSGASQPTPLGELLSQIPVDIIVGRVLILGTLFGLTDPVLTVAAGLSVQSIFASSRQMLGLSDYSDSTTQSDLGSHDSDSLLSEDGDLLTMLQVYEAWSDIKRKRDVNSKKWCRRRGIEEQRLYDISKLRAQFYQVLEDQNLIDDLNPSKDEAEGSTKDDRRELSKLRKRTLHEESSSSKSSKRRVLSVDVYHEEDPNDEIHARIQDLEFRLAIDRNLAAYSSHSTWDLIRRKSQELKLVLAAGLYPQVAIPDESNSFKTDNSSDLAFHTKTKNFLLIHPTSIFYKKPAFLAPSGRKVVTKGRHSMSSFHNVLAFTSLLETNKPYLVNCMQVPAVQILLLCSSSVDTSEDCSKILFDGWLEVTFSKPADGEALVRTAIKLRSSWDLLLQNKLKCVKKRISPDGDEGEDRPIDNEKPIDVEEIYRLERELPAILTQFLELKPVYSLRRVFTAELSHLYISGLAPSDVSQTDEDEAAGRRDLDDFTILKESFDSMGQKTVVPELGPHPVKGLLSIFSLKLDDGDDDGGETWSEALARVWTCPNCEQTMVVSAGERLRHEASCITKPSDNDIEASVKKSEPTPGSKTFKCDVCKESLVMTPSEFLRHKLKHKSQP